MIPASEILDLSPSERGNLIISKINNFASIEDEIERSQAISNVINSFINEYFLLKISADNELKGGSILEDKALIIAFQNEIDNFSPIAVAELKKSQPTTDELVKSSKNIYEMSGAVKLSFANRVTRNLSTTMGLLWERLANVSPYALNPEMEFNLKIKGIDLISKNINNDNIEYQQLKTQHNTLTGSQKQRSVDELIIHDNPVFCACLANNSSWTFNHPDIPRVSGEEFWSRIGISYPIFLNAVQSLISNLEDEYLKILSEQ